MDITSRWHDESVMPATRSGTATLRISASWAHRSKLMSPSELACSLLLPLPCLGCATWSWRTGSWILRKAILAGLREDPCLGLRDRRSTDFPRSGNGILAAESAIREYDVTARPIGRNQIGRLDRLRNMKRLRALQSCPVSQSFSKNKTFEVSSTVVAKSALAVIVVLPSGPCASRCTC